MNRLNTIYARARERVPKNMTKAAAAQTMTEYALILTAVAIVAYVTYQVMGQEIGSMVNTVDTALSGAWEDCRCEHAGSHGDSGKVNESE